MWRTFWGLFSCRRAHKHYSVHEGGSMFNRGLVSSSYLVNGYFEARDSGMYIRCKKKPLRLQCESRLAHQSQISVYLDGSRSCACCWWTVENLHHQKWKTACMQMRVCLSKSWTHTSPIVHCFAHIHSSLRNYKSDGKPSLFTTYSCDVTCASPLGEMKIFKICIRLSVCVILFR